MSPSRANPAEVGLIRSAIADLRGRPLACAVAFFALGIWAGAKSEIPAWCLFAATGVVALAAVALTVRRAVGGAAALVVTLAALVGGSAYSLSQVRRAGDVCTFDRTARTLEGVVVSEPHQWGDLQTMAVELAADVNSATGERAAARGRVWLTCVSEAPIARGDLVRFTSVIYTPREATGPGEVTRAPALRAAGVSALAYVSDARLVQRLGSGHLGPLERAGIAFREHVERVLRDSMPGPYRDVLAALLGSIVFGAKAHPPPPEVMESFRRAGVIHVLVVSGTQISLLFGVVYAPGVLAVRFRRRRYGAPAGGVGFVAPAPTHASLALVLTLIAAYALFTEGGRPVARAAVMGGLLAFGLMLRQIPHVADHHALEFDRYTMLAVAALALLVVRPAALFDIGLQLSLAAVGGLVYLGPRMIRPLRAHAPLWLAITVAATMSAQLAVLPVMAWHFRCISPVGFLANLFVILAAGMLLATGITVALLGSISLPLATAVNFVNAPLLWAAARFTYIMANLPGATVRVQLTSRWPVLAYYAGLIILAALADRWWQRRHPDEETPPA